MTMSSSYVALRERWKSGERDRGAALQLMFLAWMHWAEPSFLTGLDDDGPEPAALWREIFSYLGGADSSDAEFLYVAALMVELFPYALGDDQEWTQRAEELWKRARSLQPEGMAASVFEGRGEYGKYFAHQGGSGGLA